MTLQAFKIAEHPDVQLPVSINLDGFILSHVIEPILVPDKDEVAKFLPAYKPVLQLDPAAPISMGIFRHSRNLLRIQEGYRRCSGRFQEGHL